MTKVGNEGGSVVVYFDQQIGVVARTTFTHFMSPPLSNFQSRPYREGWKNVQKKFEQKKVEKNLS